MKQTASGTTVQRREPSLVMTSRGEMGRDRRATQQEEDTHTHTHMHVHTHTHTYNYD